MNQYLLDHIDKSLKNKPAPIRWESKADIILKKLFDKPFPTNRPEKPDPIMSSE